MIHLNENGTVRLAGLQSEMDVAMYVVDRVLSAYGIQTVITAGTEEFDKKGKLIHAINSYHPRGYALDFRDRNFPSELYPEILRKMQGALHQISLAYDLEKEGNHLHIEFDLKKFWKLCKQ